MDDAVKHCTKGAGIWTWASSDQDSEPDIVMASCGDVATMEALAATALLRQHFSDLKVRFVNVVDLFRLVPDTEHPHGFSLPLPGAAGHTPHSARTAATSSTRTPISAGVVSEVGP
jgi:xylulose-5-phosphate/fructose-6-phosphate phosphoketolase